MPTVTLNLPETTFVSSAGPDSNNSFYPVMYVGTDPGLQDCIGLVNVALPALPKSVSSAVLQLSVIMKSGEAPSSVAVSQLSADFDAKSVTYNSMPSLIPTAAQFSVSASELYTSIQADLTDIVNAWLSGAAPNHGIALTGSDGTVVQFGTNNIVYESYFPKLILSYSDAQVPTGYIYNTDGQSVAQENPILFTDNGPLCKVTHDAGSEKIAIEESGLYLVWYRVTGTDANQFAVFQNAAVLLSSVYGTDQTNNGGMTMVNAAAGDILTLQNHVSSGSVTLDASAGGKMPGVSASMALLKVGPNAAPDPLLTAVNAAQTNDEMLEAVAEPSLGLDLSAFNQLADVLQQHVLAGLITNRTTLGYLIVSEIQAMLNYEIAMTVVDPYNIYVKAGAVDGNGSIGMPFGDIQAGIDVAEAYGTVHIREGIYVVSSIIQCNKQGVELSGVPGASILDLDGVKEKGMQIASSSVSVTGLTFSYLKFVPIEVMAVEANYCSIVNNAFFVEDFLVGPRSVIVDVYENLKSVFIEQNKIENGLFGIIIQKNAECLVRNNNISGTRAGIVVNTDLAQMTENSWVGVANRVDIDIDPSIAGHYDLKELSAQNNNARVRVPSGD